MCMSRQPTGQRVLRKSLRGETINYRWGWFFVSFNVAENKSVFGAIAGESVALNELGRQSFRPLPALPSVRSFASCWPRSARSSRSIPAARSRR